MSKFFTCVGPSSCVISSHQVSSWDSPVASVYQLRFQMTPWSTTNKNTQIRWIVPIAEPSMSPLENFRTVSLSISKILHPYTSSNHAKNPHIQIPLSNSLFKKNQCFYLVVHIQYFLSCTTCMSHCNFGAVVLLSSIRISSKLFTVSRYWTFINMYIISLLFPFNK